MARIRTIKPSFFKNEILAELPASARLLFIGLFCFADKDGRLEDRPKRIKAEVFPYDNTDICDMLTQLNNAGFIQRYEVGNLKVIQIVNFNKHQAIHGTESKYESKLPQPPDIETFDTWTEKSVLISPNVLRNKEQGIRNKKHFVPPDVFSIRAYFKENGYPESLADKAFKYYETGEWKDSRGNQVKNWKQKMQAVWFKEENKVGGKTMIL